MGLSLRGGHVEERSLMFDVSFFCERDDDEDDDVVVSDVDVVDDEDADDDDNERTPRFSFPFSELFLLSGFL